MLKVATIILLIMLVFGGVYSLMLIFAPKMILSSGFEAETGEKLEDIQNASYLKVMVGELKHMGVLALAVSICSIFILFAGFRKAEKWAWWATLITGNLTWGYGLIDNIITGDMFNSLLHLIGIVIFLVGLFIPVKVFFAKEA
ncbi:MAG TPA: hypothetical protein ENI27_01540 [bacterium]|nr:hypothetical protein [bacterium]